MIGRDKRSWGVLGIFKPESDMGQLGFEKGQPDRYIGGGQQAERGHGERAESAVASERRR